ncbi:MAG: cytochrome c biogenesis protein ResB [Nitrospirae bacterium]|nr:cytochrome c biogenesis protein ResB [Nitrospirota bacterium]
MEKENNKKLTDKIWNFFASIKLAITVFALIALTSIIGTIIEQRADPEKNIQILSKLFGESLGPTMFSIFDKLGFMDMYHSWWFTALLILFSVNLIICSLERLPKTLKIIKDPIAPVSDEQIKNFLINKEVILKAKPDKIKDKVALAMSSVGFKNFQEIKEDKGYQLFLQKGRYGRLGVYVTHFSILIILIGAILGMRFGFNGYLNIPEGVVSNIAFSTNGKEIPLGFEIRCDNFDVEFYGASDMPKEYRSWLSIIKDGQIVVQKSIVVNNPLVYKGITFYQSSYGFIPENAGRGILLLGITSREGKTSEFQLRLGDTFHIPGSTISGKILDFSPALKVDEHGHAFTYTNQMNNPAVLIAFFDSDKHKYTGWILRRYPETGQLPEGHRIVFKDYWGVEYTGLQVRKDPGVWVVYLGCIAMSIGLFIAFFISHRKVWIKIIEDKNNSKILIGALANKNRVTLEKKIDKLISILRKNHEGR